MSTATPNKQTNTAASAPECNEPVFDFDSYWLKKGKDFADNTVNALTKRMQSYYNFLNVLLGGSFLGSIGYVTFYSTADLILFLAFLIPALAVLIARFFIAFRANKLEAFYPDLRSPTQVHTAFNRIVSNKKQQIKNAEKAVGTCLVITILCIPAGLYYNNWVSAKAKKETPKIIFHENKVEVTGKVPDSIITIKLYGKTQTKAEGEKVKDTIIELERGVAKDSVFSHLFSLDNFGLDLGSVEVKYRDGDIVKSIEKILD
ncbi:MAG: hypothetical protein WBG71_12335 [Leeuwenhoekiella sp.]